MNHCSAASSGHGWKKCILAAACIAMVLTLAPWQSARAASGSTDVTINFPDIVILHYVRYLTLTFTGVNDEEVDQGRAAAAAALADPASFDANMTPSGGTTYPNPIHVTVQRVWAVRGITQSGRIRVTPQINNADATTASGSRATMINLQVQTGSVTAGAPIDVDVPGLWNAVVGDIVFDLDISGVTTAASHTGMQYTIEATSTP